MKLSICMIVKNEEKNLDRCLISVLPLMGLVSCELIIVDTGSTDNTVEIAKKYTDKVYFHEWNNNFADMRNITLSYAKGDWILIIDADEELEHSEGISNFLDSEISNLYSASAVTLRNLIVEEQKDNKTFATIIRLYKNRQDLKYEGAVHEQIPVSGEIPLLQTTLIHYGYVNNDLELKEKKFRRNLELLKLELEKNPESIFYRHLLAGQYISHSDYKEALEECLKVYNIMKAKHTPSLNYLYLYPNLVLCYIINNNYKAAEEICKEGLQISDEHIDLQCYMGKIKFQNTEYINAIEHFNRYLDLIINFEKLSITTCSTISFSMLNNVEEIQLDIAAAYANLEEYYKALDYIITIELSRHFERAFKLFISLCVAVKRTNVINEYYSNIVSKKYSDKSQLFLDILKAYRNYLENETSQTNSNANELQNYIAMFKKNIEELVSLGKIKEATDLIKEYNSISGENIDIQEFMS